MQKLNGMQFIYNQDHLGDLKREAENDITWIELSRCSPP